LRDKIDRLSARVDAKIEKTNDRIDALNATLTQQIKETNASLSEKISSVATGLAELRGYAKTVSWVLGLAATAAAGVSIARTLDWI
jgi:hypothetical protein